MGKCLQKIRRRKRNSPLRVVAGVAAVRSCSRVGGESETCKSKVELKPQFQFTVFQLWLILLEKISRDR